MATINKIEEGQFDVEKLRHFEFEEELDDWGKTDARLMLWGPPGTGKSDAFFNASKRTASSMKRKHTEWRKLTKAEKMALWDSDELIKETYLMVDLRLSQREPVDLLGLANFAKASGCVDWDPPILMGVLAKKHCCATLLLDEINHAPPMMQLAAYQLVNEKAIGELTLADGVRIAGAGNRRCDGGAGFAMPPALCNRFDHFELVPPDKKEWTDWAFKNEKDPRVISYLSFRDEHLIDDMKEVIRQGKVAYATPRSWAHASDRLSMMPKDATTERLARKVASCVGQAKGIEFRAFLDIHGALNVDNILADPDSINSMSLDKKCALMPAMASYYKDTPSVNVLDKVFNASKRFDEDFRAVLVRFLIQANKGQDTKFLQKVMKCTNRDAVHGIMEMLQTTGWNLE